MAGKSSCRKLSLNLTYRENDKGIVLFGKDETNTEASVEIALEDKQTANDLDKLKANITSKLGRLGDSVYTLNQLEIKLSFSYFVPQSVLNNLRRQLIEKLNKLKTEKRKEIVHNFENAPMLPEKEQHLGFMANIYNEKALDFYKKHGAKDIEPAYETERVHDAECVLISKHCLRYCFKLCPKRHKVKAQDLFLVIGKAKFRLEFDCKNCYMKLIGPLK